MIKRNILSIATALVIIYLSLANSKEFGHVSFFNFPEADKVIHFIMYAFFTGVVLFENRKIIYTSKQLLIIALVSLFLGGFLEILQSLLTKTRTGSIFDFLADLTGVLFSIGLFMFLARRVPKRSENK